MSTHRALWFGDDTADDFMAKLALPESTHAVPTVREVVPLRLKWLDIAIRPGGRPFTLNIAPGDSVTHTTENDGWTIRHSYW